MNTFKQFKHSSLNLYLEEVYVERDEMPLASGFSLNDDLRLMEVKLTHDFSKARRIKSKEIHSLLERNGFYSIEVLGKVEVTDPEELAEHGYRYLRELNEDEL